MIKEATKFMINYVLFQIKVLLIDKLRSIDRNNKKINNHMFEDSSFSFEVFDCALVYISTLWEIRSNANRWFAIVRCLHCRN